MISIHSVTDASYYTNSLEKENRKLSNSDNYYTGAKSPSAWSGEGARLLGLAGQPIDAEKFKEILEGLVTNPVAGIPQQMPRERKAYTDKKTGDRLQTKQRKAWDLTISAPKSFSILGLVGGDQKVIEAHNNAASKSLEYLEKYGAQTRIKEDGEVSKVQTGNLVFAKFDHETNRSDEPQIHTHCVLMNMTFDSESKVWRALSNEEIFNLRASADLIYKTELVNQIQKLGYDASLIKSGKSYDIAVSGIDKSHEQAFSQRSADVEAFKEKTDKTTALKESNGKPLSNFEKRWIASDERERYQISTLASRGEKTHLAKESLQEGWSALADSIGLKMPVASKLIATNASQSFDIKGAIKNAIAHLSEKEQAFSRADLIKESCAFSMGNASVSNIEAEVDKTLKGNSLIEKADQSLTTPSAIRDEKIVIDAIKKGKNYGGCVLSNIKNFDKAVEKFEARKSIETGKKYELTEQQKNAARNILMHPDRWQAVQGAAGTGKTVSLELVNEVATANGWNVIGLAPTARAAQTLGKEAGIINIMTAQKFIQSSAEHDLGRLKSQLSTINEAIKTKEQEVGARDMNITTLGLGFAKDRYIFTKEGDVFKATQGFFGLRNAAALSLADRSRERQFKAQKDFKNANSLGGLLSSSASYLSARTLNQLGQDLTKWRKVGVVEGFIAKVINSSRAKSEAAPMVLRAKELHEQIQAIEQGKTLVIMDEAGLSGTNDMSKVIEKTLEMGASKGVFQGDIRQHGSVPAGNVFNQMQEDGIHTSIIDVVMRQSKGSLALASVNEMMHGNFRIALEMQHWIETGPEKADLHKGVADAYFAEREKLTSKHIENNKGVGVICPINKDRDAITEEIRNGLKARGEIASEGVSIKSLRDAGLSISQAKQAFNYGEGQVLVANQKIGDIERDEQVTVIGVNAKENTITLQKENGKEITLDAKKTVGEKYGKEVKNLQSYNPKKLEYSIGDKITVIENIRGDRDRGTEKITNGTFGKVSAVSKDGSVTVEFDGKERTLSKSELGKTEHGYVSTSVKAQGETNQRQIAVMPSDAGQAINEKQAYVTNTRAKDSTIFITDNKQKVLNSLDKAADNSTALEKNTKQKESLKPERAKLDPAKTMERNLEKAFSGAGLQDKAKAAIKSPHLEKSDQKLFKNKNIKPVKTILVGRK